MKKFIFITITILLAISGFLYYFFPGNKALAEEDGRIIKIESPADNPESAMVISSPELEIDKQIIVIWLNMIKGKEINIIFDDPKTVIAATSDPMGFTTDDSGGFSARYMPHIATASLRFIKSGTYSYTVTSQINEPKSSSGKIIVP
ncbi:MAG: hypothetical protein KKA41_03445 [Proteobacteria bacterium]|nr:hypothetical protein [Pseudomonadota bacterium]